jgi:uncharacterized damage-inducible protein DinB
MLETLIRLFKYDAWANQEVLRSLRAMASPPARAVKLLAHILSAQWLWLERMKGVPQSLPVWPEWTLEEMEAQLPRLKREWKVFLGEKKPPDLALRFQYTNSKGEHFSSTIGDTAMHVAMHGAYHRGQIALLVRDAGAEPAYTDYIHAVRTEKV